MLCLGSINYHLIWRGAASIDNETWDIEPWTTFVCIECVVYLATTMTNTWFAAAATTHFFHAAVRTRSLPWQPPNDQECTASDANSQQARVVISRVFSYEGFPMEFSRKIHRATTVFSINDDLVRWHTDMSHFYQCEAFMAGSAWQQCVWNNLYLLQICVFKMLMKRCLWCKTRIVSLWFTSFHWLSLANFSSTQTE